MGFSQSSSRVLARVVVVPASVATTGEEEKSIRHGRNLFFG